MFSSVPGPIGIFDSGYGGLTIFDKIRAAMPGYDYIYLGDNARSPYGTRSFEVVYRFTKQAVETLFNEGCQLVIRHRQRHCVRSNSGTCHSGTRLVGCWA